MSLLLSSHRGFSDPLSLGTCPCTKFQNTGPEMFHPGTSSFHQNHCSGADCFYSFTQPELVCHSGDTWRLHLDSQAQIQTFSTFASAVAAVPVRFFWLADNIRNISISIDGIIYFQGHAEHSLSHEDSQGKEEHFQVESGAG